MREHAEALVVGAGPVGMTAALLLAEQGVTATVIDAASGTAAHSYACALHSRSLELLTRFGLKDEIFSWGFRISRIALYDGSSREAEINLSELDLDVPFITVLPQNALEWMLERTLNQTAKIKVHWRHRLSALQSFDSGVIATMEELAAGREAAEFHPTMVMQYQFLVGADGHGSTVRRCLGIDYEEAGQTEVFSVFEFDTDIELEPEMRIVLNENTASVFWPISKRRCRWSFQTVRPEGHMGFPEKERKRLEIENSETYRRIEQELSQFIRERAPWFAGRVKKLIWAKQVQFERRLAKQFSDGRCWLIGDAAHQTCPIGVQSLNVGLWEAEELAGIIKNSAGNAAAPAVCQTWNQLWRKEWLQLLGVKSELSVPVGASDWIKRHLPRIPSCLPASGEHLGRLLHQLKEFPH